MQIIPKFSLFLCAVILILAACVPVSTLTSEPPTVTAIPTTPPDLPEITSVAFDHQQLARYESIEMTLSARAQYDNPYDARQVRLDGVFRAPDGAQMNVPGFWDGESAWRVRFTPSQVGAWTYQLVLIDSRGPSHAVEGKFDVIESDLHGWLQVGRDVNPDYSARYLAYHDGTPFYGYGYCEALNILIDGFNVERGVGLFDNMKAAGENFVVWWPLYSMSPIKSSYNDYSAANMNTIDVIVRDAEKKGVFLIFTVWDHPQLRARNHPWGTGNWDNNNGFRKLGDLPSFFTDEEAWAWQENFYRYIIARWGYSPAIGMWQTASEINGTEAFDQTNPWHDKLNAYFVDHDPYRHPTTASMSGDVNWPEGFAAMDAPSVHVYALEGGAVESAKVLAYWTQVMWDEQEKPNWVGEFGVTSTSEYPELFHNSIWAALASGAALTPAEWNSGGSWGRPTPEMKADMANFIQFVSDIPLVKLDPSRLEIIVSDEQVRGWGVAGMDGGLFWVQDFALEGQPIAALLADETVRSGVRVELAGLAEGVYLVTPYDTWQGIYLDAFEITCAGNAACPVSLPDFKHDMAFKIEHK